MRHIFSVPTYRFDKPRPVLTGAQALRQVDELAAHFMDRTGNPEKHDMLDNHPSRVFARDDDWFRPVLCAYASMEDMKARREKERQEARKKLNELMRASISEHQEQIRAFREAPAVPEMPQEIGEMRQTRSLSLPSLEPITVEEMMETTAFVLPELPQPIEQGIPDLEPVSRTPLQAYSDETGDLFEAAGIVVAQKAAPPKKRRGR